MVSYLWHAFMSCDLFKLKEKKNRKKRKTEEIGPTKIWDVKMLDHMLQPAAVCKICSQLSLTFHLIQPALSISLYA